MSESPLIFDRALIRRRRQRANVLDAATFLLDHAADDLVDRLGAVLRRFEIAVDLGTPTDAVCNALARRGAADTIIAVCTADEGLPPASGNEKIVVADEEALPFRDGSLDLVVSALTLQFVNDLPGTLIQIRRALKPDGLFMAALIGGERSPRRKANLRAACRRASRHLPMCASLARCCSAPASRCRSPTSTASACATIRCSP